MTDLSRREALWIVHHGLFVGLSHEGIGLSLSLEETSWNGHVVVWSRHGVGTASRIEVNTVQDIRHAFLSSDDGFQRLGTCRRASRQGAKRHDRITIPRWWSGGGMEGLALSQRQAGSRGSILDHTRRGSERGRSGSHLTASGVNPGRLRLRGHGGSKRKRRDERKRRGKLHGACQSQGIGGSIEFPIVTHLVDVDWSSE